MVCWDGGGAQEKRHPREVHPMPIVELEVASGRFQIISQLLLSSPHSVATISTNYHLRYLRMSAILCDELFVKVFGRDRICWCYSKPGEMRIFTKDTKLMQIPRHSPLREQNTTLSRIEPTRFYYRRLSNLHLAHSPKSSVGTLKLRRRHHLG